MKKKIYLEGIIYIINTIMKKQFLLTWIGITSLSILLLTQVSATEYTQEQIEAYNWAYQNWITTQSTIEAANLEWNITRQAMAKMISIFAKEFLWKTPDISKSCAFIDSNITPDLVQYVTESCQLGLMGQWVSSFRPTDPISRAEFWTILSRALWWNTYESNWGEYYIWHLNALKEKWIMNNISSPKERLEKRGNVMIMLMRSKNQQVSYESIYSLGNTDKNPTHTVIEKEDPIVICEDKNWELTLNKDTIEWVYSYKDENWKHTCSLMNKVYSCKDKDWNVTTPKIEGDDSALYSCSQDGKTVTVWLTQWGITYDYEPWDFNPEGWEEMNRNLSDNPWEEILYTWSDGKTYTYRPFLDVLSDLAKKKGDKNLQEALKLEIAHLDYSETHSWFDAMLELDGIDEDADPKVILDFIDKIYNEAKKEDETYVKSLEKILKTLPEDKWEYSLNTKIQKTSEYIETLEGLGDSMYATLKTIFEAYSSAPKDENWEPKLSDEEGEKLLWAAFWLMAVWMAAQSVENEYQTYLNEYAKYTYEQLSK